MKCYMDRLRELPSTRLDSMIAEQEREIEIKQRDLSLMKQALAEK